MRKKELVTNTQKPLSTTIKVFIFSNDSREQLMENFSLDLQQYAQAR